MKIDMTKPKPFKGITAKDGLLWKDGEIIYLPEADFVAQCAGYPHAEDYVKALIELQKEPT